VHHQHAVLEVCKLLMPQPTDDRLALGGIQDRLQGVFGLEPAKACGNRQEIEVMVAQHHTASALVGHHPAQYLEGFRAPVDKIAYQPERGLFGMPLGKGAGVDALNQRQKLVETTLDVADCPTVLQAHRAL